MGIICNNCGYKNTSYDFVCFQCRKPLDEEKQKAGAITPKSGKTKYVPRASLLERITPETNYIGRFSYVILTISLVIGVIGLIVYPIVWLSELAHVADSIRGDEAAFWLMLLYIGQGLLTMIGLFTWVIIIKVIRIIVRM
jgi:hypothetical protein